MFARSLFLSLMVILLLGLVVPALAQDETPSPRVAVEESPAQPVDAQVVLDLGTALSGLIVALLAGMAIGGASVFAAMTAIIKKLDQSPLIKDAMERLYFAFAPDHVRLLLKEGVSAGKELNRFAEDITDGKLSTGQVVGQSPPTAPSTN